MTTQPAPLPAGLHRIVVPLVGSPLGSVNAYLIESPEGPILIDTGWQTDDARAAIERALAEVGAKVEDLAQIVLTHGHPDHTGLAAPLREGSGAPIALHPEDWPLVAPARREGEGYIGQAARWQRLNGMPDDEQGGVRGSRSAMAGRNPPFVPDRPLADGEGLCLGPFRFRVWWCPGHARGEVCLHDADAGLLIVGDHVLPHISPNVGIYRPDDGDPLGDYLASLARIRDLPATVVAPGHGAPFAGLAARVDELIAHHEARLAEILALLGSAPALAYDLCRALTWSGGRRAFADFPAFQRAMALAETIAHLELLARRGLVVSEEGEGRLWWRCVS